VGVGVYKHRNRDLKDVDETEIESYEQDYVYNNSHVGVYFEIEKGNYECGTEHETRSAPKTQIDINRQTGREETIHTRHKLIETGSVRHTDNECARGRPRLSLVKRHGHG